MKRRPIRRGSLTINPFVSEAQRAWMHANKPEMAKEWEDHTPKHKKLPSKLKSNSLAHNLRRKGVTSLPKPPADYLTQTVRLRRQFTMRLRKLFALLKQELADRKPSLNCNPGQMRGADGKCGPGISLDIPRDKMPQIKGEDLEEFRSYCDNRGVYTHSRYLSPKDLSPTQSQFRQERVDSLPEDALKQPVVISKDLYVLDGTHRWVKARQDGADQMPVLEVGLPVREALELMRGFPKAKFTANAFCPTGPGGGQDNSCSPSSSGASKTLAEGEIGPWAQRNGMSEWSEKLTDEERRAISAYQSGSSRNEYLRNDNAKFDHASAEWAKTLDKALSSAPALKEGVTALRGLDAREDHVRDFLAKAAVGSEFQDHGFCSTTLSANYMESFHASGAERKTDVVVEINVPKGVKAAFLSGFGKAEFGGDKDKLDKEKELLLPRGGKFRVKAVEKWKDEGAKVVVDYLGSSPRPLPEIPERLKKYYQTNEAAVDRFKWRQGDLEWFGQTDNAFCPTGLGGGQDNSCPPNQSHANETLMQSLKSLGADIAHLEHVAKDYIKDKIASAVNRLPPKLQSAVNATYAVAKVGTRAAFVTWTTTQSLAERVARERGLTDEQARRLRGTLSGLDITTFKPLMVAQVALGVGHATAGALSFIPPATASYLAYSTARDPLATYRAAKGMISDAVHGVSGAWRTVTDPLAGVANVSPVDLLTNALAAHGFDDWYIALLTAALEETNNLGEAIKVADGLYEDKEDTTANCDDSPHEMIDLPDVKQDDDSSCGAAISMSVGHYFGVGPKSLSEWKERLGTTERDGTAVKRIVAYLKELGLEVNARGGMSLEDLRECWAQGKPVIAPVQQYGPSSKSATSDSSGHYVAVIALGLGHVFVQDPSASNVIEDEQSNQAKGRVIVEEADWLMAWHDKDADGSEYVRYGIVVGPPTRQEVTANVDNTLVDRLTSPTERNAWRSLITQAYRKRLEAASPVQSHRSDTHHALSQQAVGLKMDSPEVKEEIANITDSVLTDLTAITVGIQSPQDVGTAQAKVEGLVKKAVRIAYGLVPTINSFCLTGVGGGVDPSCSPGKSVGSDYHQALKKKLLSGNMTDEELADLNRLNRQQKGNTPSHSPSTTGIDSVHAKAVVQRVRELGVDKGNLVHFQDLHDSLPHLSKEQLHQAIKQAQREGRLSLVSAEGRHGLTQRDRDAAMKDDNSSALGGGKLLFASIRQV